MRQMFREDFALDVAAYPYRGEICAGKDKRGHVADARAGHHHDVLEAVRLLDEADRLLDAPSFKTASATDASSVSSSRFRLSLFSVYIGFMSSSIARTIDESFVSPDAWIP